MTRLLLLLSVAACLPWGRRLSCATALSTTTSTLLCLSWDGVVADTLELRIDRGIRAAREAWPPPERPLLPISADGDTAWLKNKMEAIAPHLVGGFEYALLARMLLEEQQLDPSVGKTGKYASQFHPQGPVKSIAIPSARSSRPLTVGEIQANWMDNLLDTLTIKYKIDNKNPVPILEDYLSKLPTDQAPKLQPVIADAIQDSPSQIVVIVSTPSDLDLARASLPDLSVAASVNDVTDHSAIILDTDIQVLQDLSTRANAGLLTHHHHHYVGANWATLQKARRFAAPQLSLSLASWTSSPAQQDQATMDPAFTVVTRQEVLEMASARIVKPT